MKMLCKTMTVALMLLLVCLLSTSAFAASEFGDSETINGDHVIIAEAEISQIATSAEMFLAYAFDFSDASYNITCIYDYKKYGASNTYSAVGYGADCEYDVNYPYGRNVFSISTSQSSPIQQFTKAVYTFNATFTAWGGTYTYNPEIVTIEP